jgi:predicted nicotinamide N-methyase
MTNGRSVSDSTPKLHARVCLTMSFSFNFLPDSHDEGLKSTLSNSEAVKQQGTGEMTASTPFREVLHSADYDASRLTFDTLAFANDSFSLNKIDAVSLQAREDAFSQEMDIPIHSDLVPGKYGGGFKVWECSIDLVEYILSNEWYTAFLQATTNGDINGEGGSSTSMSLSESLENRTVLELGCGHGLPGLACLLQGAQQVIFSDLNYQVLEDVTWPNILLNCRDTEADKMHRCQCIGGDWSALTTKLQTAQQKVHLILSAETIYTKENCSILLNLIVNCLSEDGLAILATKRYYFGVGGGSSDLANLIQEQYPTLLCHQVASFQDGKSNIRDILVVKFYVNKK